MEIKINPGKLYTKSEYAKAYNISRPKLDKMIESKEVQSIRVKGTTLIVAK